MTTDLASRLSETLDELERVARKAHGDGLNPSWHARRHQVFAAGGDTVCGHIALIPTATHIARWDPEAVLRLVGAVRKMIDEYRKFDVPRVEVLNNWERGARIARLSMLEMLAAGFGILPEES